MIKLKDIIEEAIENKPKFLWHGSINKYNILNPHQAKDIGGSPGSNQNAIYATDNKIFAIQMGLFTKDSDTGIPDWNIPNPKIVLFKGNIRRGRKVYLHVVPSNTFQKTSTKHEWYSKDSVRPVKVVEVNVNDYLHLMRLPTKKDLEIRKKYK